jgi:thioredoxin 1
METVLTDSNFKDEISTGLVLVDFWAPWCGPCRMLSPIIEEVAKEIENVKVGKLNVDENPQTAQEYQIMSIPNVILFKDGEPVEALVGLRPKEAYLEAVEAHK